MMQNKALHRMAIPLRSIAAGELGRWAACLLAPKKCPNVKSALPI
jgi:hypothetical protein